MRQDKSNNKLATPSVIPAKAGIHTFSLLKLLKKAFFWIARSSRGMTVGANTKLAYAIALMFASMLILAFASVPIYNIFCKATGFGGTTMRGESFYQQKKGTRQITIEFDSNVDKDLPWSFIPKHRKTKVTTGENALIFYESENLSDKDIIGTSVYNVTPSKAGQYFVKVHCFCFEEQLLVAGQKMLMPVSFYLDPALDEDPLMQDVDTITLSYSFFKVRELEK